MSTEITFDRISHPEDPRITVGFEWLSPQRAGELAAILEKTQRTRSQKKVEQYVRDMIADKFPFNGATMCFDLNGDLVDGQHRAQAIAESGVGRYVLVVRGLPLGVIDAMDLGMPRTFRTWLNRKVRPPRPSIVGPLTIMTWHWLHDNYAWRDIQRKQYGKWGNVTPSAPEAQEVFREYQAEIVAAAVEAARVGRLIPANTITPAVLGFFILTTRRLDLFKANQFIELLTGTEDKRTGDEHRPIRVLIKQMARNSRPNKNGARDGWKWLHYFYSAWNAWLLGNSPNEENGYYASPTNPGPKTLKMPLDPKDLDGTASREIFHLPGRSSEQVAA